MKNLRSVAFTTSMLSYNIFDNIMLPSIEAHARIASCAIEFCSKFPDDYNWENVMENPAAHGWDEGGVFMSFGSGVTGLEDALLFFAKYKLKNLLRNL